MYLFEVFCDFAAWDWPSVTDGFFHDERIWLHAFVGAFKAVWNFFIRLCFVVLFLLWGRVWIDGGQTRIQFYFFCSLLQASLLTHQSILPRQLQLLLGRGKFPESPCNLALPLWEVGLKIFPQSRFRLHLTKCQLAHRHFWESSFCVVVVESYVTGLLNFSFDRSTKNLILIRIRENKSFNSDWSNNHFNPFYSSGVDVMPTSLFIGCKLNCFA